VIQNHLAHTHTLRSYLYVLILADVLQALLKAHHRLWNHAGLVVRTRSTDVGQLLCLGSINHQVVVVNMLTNNLATVNLLTWVDEELTAILQLIDGVSIGSTCLQRNHATVAVVTEKLGGSIGSLTTYTVIANVFTMVIIPSLFPMVEKGADVSFLFMSAMVFRNVTTVLVVPLLLALLSRKFLPKWVDKVKSVKDLGFYMWCFNLTILMGETVRNILHAEVSGWILALLLIVPLFVCLIQFAIGKAVGRHYDASISAGQALGQKNTIVGIWLTLTFLNPLAAVAPGAYVVWQNLVNGWQLWYKEKYGKLKW
jgi:predicted Na+-dependent transporter